MAVEEIKRPEQDPGPEMKTSSDERETRSGKQSPRCVLEIPISDGSPVSDRLNSPGSSSSSSSSPSASNPNAIEKQIPKGGSLYGYGIPWKGIFSSGKRQPRGRRFSTSSIPLLSNCDLTAKTLRQKLLRMWTAEVGVDCGLGFVRRPHWRNFTYAELEAATDKFCPERLVGKGGHAEVYKGFLPDGTLVAVKRLRKDDKEDERTADFLSELGIIAHVDHPNTDKLIGFGIERGLYLVLQYATNGSVETHLQGSSEEWDWKTRYKVAVGVAEGLSYLHHTCQRRIIHRDIKASNILLGENNEPLISDFGLAKWLPDKWLHHVVHPIEGTFGYLAPEYFMHGIADEKTDVFAYGVLLLELITGRHAVAVDPSRQSLVMWAKPFLDSNNVKELADPQLVGKYDPVEMKRAMAVASMCIHHSPGERPYMNKVVEILRGEGGPVDHMKQASMGPRSLLLDACDLEDYTCSNYLQDLNRHRELVME